MADRTLSTTRQSENPSSVITHGNTDAWVCICKAHNPDEDWMRSTKAMEIRGCGVLVQVSTYDKGQVAEALSFIPKARIDHDKKQYVIKHKHGV